MFEIIMDNKILMNKNTFKNIILKLFCHSILLLINVYTLVFLINLKVKIDANEELDKRIRISFKYTVCYDVYNEIIGII